MTSEALAADLVIVGAGPAGCAAAITAARAGLSVVVVDKARFPRDKTCGDGLTTGALRRLQSLGLSYSTVESSTPIDELAFFGPTGRQARIGISSPSGLYAAVVTRRDLDSALVALARQHGANIFEGPSFTTLAQSGEMVTLGFDDGTTVNAPRAIAADGAWSPLRRAALELSGHGTGGAPAQLPEWMAMRSYVSSTTKAAKGRFSIGFDAVPLPGYSWVFPLPTGRANVGVFVRRDSVTNGGSLKRAWEAFVTSGMFKALVGPDAELLAPPRAWPIPTRIELSTLSLLNGAILVAGDAAGSADPFTGEGIAQALATGEAAARAIARSPGSRRGAGDLYKEAVRSSLVHDHALARLCSAVCKHPRAVRGIVFSCARSPRLGGEIGRWLVEVYRRDLIFVPSAWRRGARAVAGAYAGQPEALGVGGPRE